MIIKLLLIASAVGAAAFILRHSAHGERLALRRLAFFGFIGAWFLAVMAPGAVTWVAHLVGVGRGTDLVLYVLAVSFLYSVLAHHQQIRSVEDRIARLSRAMALATETGVAAPQASGAAHSHAHGE